MKKSILFLVFTLTLSLTKLSFAGLVEEQWCVKCPPGTNLTLFGRDRYYCMVPGTNQSAGVPLWAKPSWAKVIWDVQGGRCIDTYIRFGDEFCYRCPVGYAITTAVTDYGKQKGYTNTGRFACFGGAVYPESWKNEASCNAYGCNFGQKNTVEECLALGERKGAMEVVYGVKVPRLRECWLQNSCQDKRPHKCFDYYRR
jgi:hypothetical protein